MNKMAKRNKTQHGIEGMEIKELKIICYEDDVIIIAKNGDNLQRMLHTPAVQYNMIIYRDTTKTILISKETI